MNVILLVIKNIFIFLLVKLERGEQYTLSNIKPGSMANRCKKYEVMGRSSVPSFETIRTAQKKSRQKSSTVADIFVAATTFLTAVS
jgi:hypothetical protein